MQERGSHTDSFWGRVKNTVREIEGKGPLDVSIAIGFVLYGWLAAQFLPIVGAGLGVMRYLLHRKLNPEEAGGRNTRAQVMPAHA